MLTIASLGVREKKEDWSGDVRRVGLFLNLLKTVELSLHAFKLGWLEMATSEFPFKISLDFIIFWEISNSLQNDELWGQEDMMWEIWKAT